MAGKSILVVDDNPQNLKLARVLLLTEGYDVHTAADAEEAMRLLETFTPHLILMDLQLPGMDGLELTRRLKSDPARQRIVIIALTAYAMKGDREKCIEAGAWDYLSKPVDTDQMLAVLRAWLHR